MPPLVLTVAPKRSSTATTCSVGLLPPRSAGPMRSPPAPANETSPNRASSAGTRYREPWIRPPSRAGTPSAGEVRRRGLAIVLWLIVRIVERRPRPGAARRHVGGRGQRALDRRAGQAQDQEAVELHAQLGAAGRDVVELRGRGPLE